MRRSIAVLFLTSLPALAATPATGPRLLAAGIVTTGDSESHATLAPDGALLYFVKLAPDFSHWTIVETHRSVEGWSAPEIAPFSGRFDDADLSFAPDGQTIYFISNRPEGDGTKAKEETDL